VRSKRQPRGPHPHHLQRPETPLVVPFAPPLLIAPQTKRAASQDPAQQQPHRSRLRSRAAPQPRAQKHPASAIMPRRRSHDLSSTVPSPGARHVAVRHRGVRVRGADRTSARLLEQNARATPPRARIVRAHRRPRFRARPPRRRAVHATFEAPQPCAPLVIAARQHRRRSRALRAAQFFRIVPYRCAARDAARPMRALDGMMRLVQGGGGGGVGRCPRGRVKKRRRATREFSRSFCRQTGGRPAAERRQTGAAVCGRAARETGPHARAARPAAGAARCRCR